MTRREEWRRAVLCYTSVRSAEAVEAITDQLVAAEVGGNPSCVWHEVVVYARAHGRPDASCSCHTCAKAVA